MINEYNDFPQLRREPSLNLILSKEHFKSKPSTKSITKFCEKAEGEVDGLPVVVVDTPALFDMSLSNQNV